MQRLRYRIDLGSSSAVPPLLKAFATWLSTQPYGAVGCFSMDVQLLPDENTLVFASLPNERQLAIELATGKVVLRWAHGLKRGIARSFAAFLTLLAQSELGIIALDAGQSAARTELATWLQLAHHAGPRASSAKPRLDSEPGHAF